ncbi:MAG: hypothetical protein COZ34_00500 [Candidatus Pacebacteria bacterium CG_4_10_14_3_um_filter_34_15]|nr:O-antigen ligase family protein [Candidatus Paceibacterota bacterium]PIX81950.1 MAG: hypothetical protein COZ34_00500 [Candidatus Pacebacteria bacterium CG_4_10_14_3_um_filter_34_15]
MNLSLKKSIFLFLFSCFQVLIFFSFYTAYELIVVSFFMVFLLFYFYYFNLEIVLDRKLLFLWLGFLFLLFISSFSTHSIPLSLDSLIFHISSFCIFVFFNSLNSRKIFSKSELVFSFILIGLALSAFFIAFFSFPDLSTFLLPVNLFTSSFGHTHFAALLLLLIPLAWWFVFSQKFPSFHNRHFILVLLYVLLIFTFGRFAVVLCLVQLPFLYKFAYKAQFSKIFIVIISLVLLLFLATIAFFSLNSIENCQMNEFRSKVCKPLSGDSRKEYFAYALRGFKSNILFGYGPGTFSLIDKKYNPNLQYSSIYAHNVFIQMFVESGIFTGSVYLLLIAYLFKKMFAVNKKAENKYIFIGLISLLANAFIDYDWNTVSIYQMTMIFSAIVLWDYPKSDKNINTIFLRSIWIILTFGLIILGIINVTTKILISVHEDNIAFKIFPYFYSQSNYFLTFNSLSEDQRQVMYKIYKNHEKFIWNNIINTQSNERKKELYTHYSQVNQLFVTNETYLKFLEEIGDFKSLGDVSQRGLALIMEIDSANFPQSYQNKSKLMSYIHESAINLIKSDDLNIAVDYYNSILQVLYVVDINKDFHLFYKEFFSETSPWGDNVSIYLHDLYDKNPKLVRIELLKIEEMHSLSNKNEYQDTLLNGRDLAILASSIAFNDLKNGNLNEAAEMYILAQKFENWIFNYLSSDFLDQLKTDEDKIMFWSQMEEFPGEYFGKYSDEVARAHFILLRDALDKNDIDLANKISKRILKIAP